MKIIKPLTVIFLLFTATQSLAFSCYFTLAKDSCWVGYDVKVTVLDAQTEQPITTVEVPKGKSWGRQAFNCQPGQKLKYEATFQPNFWQSEANKTYKSLRFWFLPNTISSKTSAWEIPVCYPAAFSEVPFPPNVGGNCQCDFKGIPPIKPQ